MKTVKLVVAAAVKVGDFIKRNGKTFLVVGLGIGGVAVCQAADVTIPDPATAVSTIETVIGGIMVFSVGAWGLARALKLGAAWLNKGK